jgi:hypothetical protein
MTFRYSEAVRNAGLDARIAVIGPSPRLCIFAEEAPEELGNADPGQPLVTIVLPAQWMTGATNGVTTNKGIWAGKGEASGKAASFRIYSADNTCQIQGDIPGDLKLDNINIAENQNVAVRVFAISSGNG